MDYGTEGCLLNGFGTQRRKRRRRSTTGTLGVRRFTKNCSMQGGVLRTCLGKCLLLDPPAGNMEVLEVAFWGVPKLLAWGFSTKRIIS